MWGIIALAWIGTVYAVGLAVWIHDRRRRP